MNRLIEEIHCRDDDGENYTVHIFQEFQNAKSMGLPDSEIPGMKEAFLAGTRVRVSQVKGEFGAFQILDTDRIIRRIVD